MPKSEYKDIDKLTEEEIELVDIIASMNEVDRKAFLQSLTNEQLITLQKVLDKAKKFVRSDFCKSDKKKRGKVNRNVRGKVKRSGIIGEGTTIACLVAEAINRVGNIAQVPHDIIDRNLIYTGYEIAKILRERKI